MGLIGDILNNTFLKVLEMMAKVGRSDISQYVIPTLGVFCSMDRTEHSL